MADPRDRGDEVPEEDVLDDNLGAEEEGEGEDLLGDNMMEDYRERPELDQYEPDLLDDGEHARLSAEQRRAAEREMARRDAAGRGTPRQGTRRPPPTPLYPTEGVISSPVRSSEIDALSPEQRRKRQRVEEFTSPGVASEPPSPEDEEEQLPESAYDLTLENIGEGAGVDKRLEQKIKRNFRQFLLKYTREDKQEPHYPDLLRKMAEEHQRHLDVNFMDLQKWSPRLALWVSEHPVRVLPILNQSLMDEAEKRFETYKAIRATEETELRVGIHSYPVREPIRELSCKHLNKLVSIQGVITKRFGVHNQVKRLYLKCSKCGYPNGPFDVQEEEDLKPGACLDCQSKGPWQVDKAKTLYRDHQKITLQESPSSVEPGKMPRSKEVILTGDQVDYPRPGDLLNITGIYRCLYDAATNARTCFPVYRTEIQSVHVQKKGDVKLLEITEDQTQQILELAKSANIRERFISSMAPSIYGMHHVKSAIALSLMGGQQKMAAGKHRIRGDINTLIVGDPGLAKSQFLKYLEQTYPRAVYTTGKGASGVGLTASVTRDEHGNFYLEGGAMVLADDGICLIDEFDKMNDQDRTSIHEAMEQQSISISKAGIVATLQARCAVVAVGNPIEGRYDPQRTFAENVNLSDPILSRFDVLCVLRDEADAVQDERLADHVLCSHRKSHPDATSEEKMIQTKLHQKGTHMQPIDQDLLQKYIVYARQKVHPKLTGVDKEKLANFYKDIRAEAFRTGGAPMTARHIESIIRLTEANARMELRQHVLAKDLDNAISMILESFIQSQKHQVAEELRKKFRRYIAQATPLSDQFMGLLERIFRDKTEEMTLLRPGGVAPEVHEVGIEMADVVRHIERYDLDLQEAHDFMSTQRFKQNFHIVDGKIHRLV